MATHALSKSSLFQKFRTSVGASESNAFDARLLEALPAEQQKLAEDYIAGHVASVLRMSPDRLTPDSRMDELGVDSLMSVTLSNTIEADSGVALGSVRFMQKPTVAKLAQDWLQAKLEGVPDGSASHAAPPSKQVDTTFVVVRAAPDARWRMFCFPGTGSDAQVFEPWAAELPQGVELIGVDYPGSLRRAHHEPESVQSLAEDLASEIFLLAGDAHVVLCGHSLGGNLAHEVALQLDGFGKPAHLLLVLAANPPSVHHVFGKEDMSLNLDYLTRFGIQVDESLFNNDQELRVAMDRCLANTRRLLSSYHRELGSAPRLATTLTYCISGEADRIVKSHDQDGWRAFAHDVKLFTLDHGHFLLGHPELLPLVLKLFGNEPASKLVE